MIRSEQITEATADMVKCLTPAAVLEYSASRRDFGKEQVFAVYDDDKLLMILGVNKRGLLLPAEIWILLGKAYNVRYAKQSKQVVRSFIRRYGGLYTMINIDSVPACRFAEFFGFRPGQYSVKHAGETYQLYEAYV